LSDSQASQLTQVLFQNSLPSNPPSITGLGAQMGAGLMERDLSSTVTDQGLAAAQAVLSPPQLEGLRLLQQMQQERQRIVLALKPKYPTTRPN
jgi:hypothetical protein